jgi:hypothetical protein
MVAKLTLEEGELGTPAIAADPIESRNVMENCLTEISAVWAYNPLNVVRLITVSIRFLMS